MIEFECECGREGDGDEEGDEVEVEVEKNVGTDGDDATTSGNVEAYQTSVASANASEVDGARQLLADLLAGALPEGLGRLLGLGGRMLVL
jgi:hypothetical protein